MTEDSINAMTSAVSSCFEAFGLLHVSRLTQTNNNEPKQLV